MGDKVRLRVVVAGDSQPCRWCGGVLNRPAGVVLQCEERKSGHAWKIGSAKVVTHGKSGAQKWSRMENRERISGQKVVKSSKSGKQVL